MRRFIAALFAFSLLSAPAMATPPVFNGNISGSVFYLAAFGYNPATCPGTNTLQAALPAALNAAGAASGNSGAILVIPPVASPCTYTGDITIPAGVTLVGSPGGYNSEIAVLGKVTFSYDAGALGVSIRNGYNGSAADAGIYYSYEDQFINSRFASLGPSSSVLVQPAASSQQVPVLFRGNDFRNQCSNCTNLTLLKIAGADNSTQTYSNATVVADNDFNDGFSSGTSTQAMLVTGSSTALSANISIVGNTESGPDLSIADVFQSSGGSGYLQHLTVVGNAFRTAPTLTNLDSTSTIAGNSVGFNRFGSTVIAGSATGPADASVAAGSLVSSVAANAGKLYLGGSSALGSLDYGATVSNTFNFNAPLQVQGTVTAPSGSATSCTGGYVFGTNGIMVISGAGAPTCTAPAGSEYLRSDGATGTRLYISAGAGTWNAVAGV